METIRPGSRGILVSAWQTFLLQQGLYTGEANGSFDAETAEASKAYQAQHDLHADGVVGNQTWAQATQDGFEEPSAPDTGDESSPAWPPKPDGVEPASLQLRQQLFGAFSFEPAPTAAVPEAIRILGSWVHDNIAQVTIPQLKGVQGAPANGVVLWNRKASDQLVALFQAWEDAGLLHLVKSFAGTWAPRFVRGSKTSLSNHCLPATADVWTTQGPASIADLKGYAGHVWSFANGHAVPGKVTGFFNNGRKPLLKIRAVGHEITCTPNHPVLVLRKKTLPKNEWIRHPSGRGQQRALYWTEMVRAELLRPGDRIVGTRTLPTMAVSPHFTHHKVQSIEHVGDGEVFDIEVDEHHNFLTDGVVVSNSWGTAIDINAAWNGLGQQPALVGHTGSVRELVSIAVEAGFYWGGWGFGSDAYQGRLDGMHFEINQLL